MPFGEPVSRMRDYLDALETAVARFRTGIGMRHVGRYYRLTRLQPYFKPGPDPDVEPPLFYVGGVNREIKKWWPAPRSSPGGDGVLDELIPAATYDDLPSLLLERYAGLAAGLVLTPPIDPPADDAFREVVASLRRESSTR